ncbi:MAG: hypothetical protein QOG56_2483, partial [Solirubrobacteraceae bacterium]|nr:hypothetical protein [Solirubrobacteraceae bacterium]
MLLQLRVALQHMVGKHRGMTSFDREPIHVTALGGPHDPRAPRPGVPGVVIHYVPELHPDDLTVVDGIPVTSVRERSSTWARRWTRTSCARRS